MTQTRQPTLLVEDNRDDIFFMTRALQKSGLPWDLQVVRDGQAAIDYFSGKGEYADRALFPLPSLMFLDLKLPYVSGFEVLAWLRAQPAFKESPVIILTSSPENRDQKRALELGAKAYMIKPPTEETLQKIARGDWASLPPPASD
jgi:CheY-like chemotaxis protein